MNDIRVYDFEFNILCVMTDVISSEWRIKYNDIGTFEGHFRLTDKICEIVLSNNYVILTQGDLQAVCVGKIVEDDLTVTGRTVNWILSRRVRPPFKSRDIFGEQFTDPESILLYCLKKGFTEPPLINDDGTENLSVIDETRKVNSFIIPEPVGSEKLKNHFWRISANDLEEITHDLCAKMSRGHRVVFDVRNKCWRFEFIFPRENNVIIAKESKNAYDVSYTENLLNYASGGWYPSFEKDKTDNQNNQTSWRYIKNDDKKGIYAWDINLSANGKSEAEKEIIKKQLIRKINAKIRNLEYGVDYKIGDVVTAYVKYGRFDKMSKYMIMGVNIRYTPTQTYEEPIMEECENETIY